MGLTAAIGGGALLGGLGGGLGGGQGPTTTSTGTSQIIIPEILKPLVQRQVGTSSGALDRLNELLSPGNEGQLVAPFDPLQLEGQQLGIDVARGVGGAIPTSLQGLLATARGDFQFGNAGFDEAVQASIRAARPNILSTFGRAGGRPGGLADAALQQVASDAFARLFDSERGRQQQAQSILPGLSLTPASILERIGGARQTQTQSEQLAPIDAISILLSAAQQGGIDLSGLLGKTVDTEKSEEGIGGLSAGLLGALGGARGGLKIFDAF